MARSGRHSGAERNRPRTIAEALGSLAEDLGIRRTLRQYDVITGWAGIVGEQVAKVTTPQRIDNGVLMVGVATAPWRAELTMRRREILEKIRRACPEAGVTDIRFR
jgi:predicted nucleic acid-binding Zn ribbon protein